MTPGEMAKLRTDLLAYCKMDTWAMVKLVERLRQLGAGQSKAGENDAPRLSLA
jgi:hypothetical protein